MEHRDLDSLFAAYREACPDPEPSAGFMPRIWERIQTYSADEQRTIFWFFFGRTTKSLATVAVAVCFLLGLLNLTASQHALDLSYPDSLAAAHTAESTNFTESTHSPVPGENDH